MRYFSLILLILLSQGALGVSLKSTAQEGNEFKYNLKNPDRPGLCLEILRMVEKQSKITFTGVEIPRSLSKILNDMEEGRIDAFFCFLKTNERIDKMDFIEPQLFSEELAIAVRADDPISVSSWRELRALKQKTILLMTGSAYTSYLRTIKGLTLDEGAPTTFANLQKLINGRGRFVVASKPSLENEIKTRGLQTQVRLLPWVLRKESQYLTVRKNLSPELKLLLSQALTEVRRTKKYKAIVMKYGVSL